VSLEPDVAMDSRCQGETGSDDFLFQRNAFCQGIKLDLMAPLI